MNYKIDQKKILNATGEELTSYFNEARNLSWNYFGKEMTIYYPGRTFPSISITGTQCTQNCLFCNKHYLQHMIHITEPKKLRLFANNLEKQGGKGMLISGGYDEDSRVPLEPFLDVLKSIKEETNLLLNVHTGLVSRKQALAIKAAGVDAVSFDLITDDKIITEILQSNKTGNDYIASFKALVQSGLRVIPHICLGLFYGDLRGNVEALKTALNTNPSLIVFLGLIPTKGTSMENSPTIEPDTLGKILIFSRLKSPQCEQSLGCMRVKSKEYEAVAIKAGINRIAVPKIGSLELAKKFGVEIKRLDTCCAM